MKELLKKLRKYEIEVRKEKVKKVLDSVQATVEYVEASVTRKTMTS